MASVHQLRQIAGILHDFGNKSTRSLFLPQKYLSKGSHVRQLACKLSPEIPLGSERDWSAEIIGCREHDRRYVVLRSKVKRLMLARVFHLDIRTGSEYRKALYRTMQEVFWIRVLILFGAQKAALWLVPRALERATKFELSDERIQLLRILRYNAMLNADRTKFERYAKELLEVEKIRDAEQLLRGYDEGINMEAVARVEMTEKGLRMAQAALAEAQPIFAEYPTFNIGLEYYRIATLAAEGSGNIPELLRLCEASQTFLSRFPHLTTPLTDGQFVIKRFRAAVGLAEFPTANMLIPECERCFPLGTPNWFVWKQIEILLRLHEQKYSLASELHRFIMAHENFSSQNEQVRQKWVYFGVYAALALWHEDRSLAMPNFDHILREVPIYKRDKIGFNASLLILQMLILSSLGDRDRMFEKGEALRQYAKRNLRRKKRSRLYAFIRTLILLIENDFNVPKTEGLARRYIERFHSPAKELVDEKESLYYPHAWEWISNGVRNYFHGKADTDILKENSDPANSEKRTKKLGKSSELWITWREFDREAFSDPFFR